MADLTQDSNFLEFIKKQNNPAAQFGLDIPQVPQVEAQVPQAAEQPQAFNAGNIEVPTDLGLGVPSMLDPTAETGDLPGTGMGILETLKESSVFADRGPSQAAQNIGAAIAKKEEPTRVATSADFTAPTGPTSTPAQQSQLPSTQPADAGLMGSPQVAQPSVPTSTFDVDQGSVTVPSGLAQQTIQDSLTPATPMTTTQPVTASGIPLAQFLSGEAIPEAGLAAESPLFSSESRGISGEAGRDVMAQESAARMAGTFSPAGTGRAVSDRERRMATGEGTSMADLTDMAKANERGASPRDVARGQKVANALGVDLKTGKPLASQEGGQEPMTRAEALAERKFQAELAQNNRQWEASEAEKAAELATGEKETAQARQKSIERMDSQLSFLKKSAIEMAELQDWSTEGFAGWFAEKLPLDTSAAQVNRLATSFQGNAFLRSIIDSKSLGATFGALSDTEGNKITAAETTLMDTKQGNEARMRAAKQIIDTIESAKARAMKEQGSGSQQQSPPSGNVPSVEGVTITAIS